LYARYPANCVEEPSTPKRANGVAAAIGAVELRRFASNGEDWRWNSAGDLFGTTSEGGANEAGGISINGTVFEIAKTAGGYATTPTTLVNFDHEDGATPVAGLLTDARGNLFGTTESGGASDPLIVGTVFEIAKTAGGYASTPATLVRFGAPFNGVVGSTPEGSLIADSAGDLFGTTSAGGANEADGTVFEIAKTAGGYASTATTLASFGGTDGETPLGSLIADSNGDLFGTTLGGGSDPLFGTVFEIPKTPTGYAGTPTTLISFSADGSDGANPAGGLIADASGDLFGTTRNGGAGLYGTVFEIKKTAAGYAGTPTTLVSFNYTDGLDPTGNLIADADGDLFGTTSGVSLNRDVASTNGTVFEIKKTAAGYTSAPTTLVSFDDADGETPVAGLIADANGDLFGTTSEGGASGIGTVFEITGSGFVTAGSAAAPASDGIFFWNPDGQAAIWGMDGTNVIAGGPVNPNAGPTWFPAGTGDFNDDGLPDILWQNTDGRAAIWDMDGTTLIGGGTVSPNPGPGWFALGAGDFNDDGHSDILWQNTSTGQASIWEMNGNTLIGGGTVSPNPGPGWFAIDTGDFNDDHRSDILWQNTRTGQVSVWEMNGTNIIGGGPVSANPGPAWRAIGTGDFNGDGFSDIAFQNSTSGQVSIWDMNGTSVIGGGAVNANAGPSWYALGLI
jgi:uncharacterized repeat protein (TIGR03803 family)